MSSAKIYVLGPEGTNGHDAAMRLGDSAFDGTKPEIAFVETNAEILEKVQEKDPGSFGIVPIENGAGGLVDEVVRYWVGMGENLMFKEKDGCRVRVIGEIAIPIAHHLMVHHSVRDLGQIDFIYSHEQAIIQCKGTVRELGLKEKMRSTKSTADAARKARDATFCGAIASRFAAQVYGLKIVRENMQDFSGNATRFHIVSKRDAGPPAANKAAIVFWVDNVPGALRSVLDQIGRFGANMTTIHSIALGTLNDYAFYCEFETDGTDGKGSKIVGDVSRHTRDLIVLGSYPKEAA